MTTDGAAFCERGPRARESAHGAPNESQAGQARPRAAAARRASHRAPRIAPRAAHRTARRASHRDLHPARLSTSEKAAGIVRVRPERQDYRHPACAGRAVRPRPITNHPRLPLRRARRWIPALSGTGRPRVRARPTRSRSKPNNESAGDRAVATNPMAPPHNSRSKTENSGPSINLFSPRAGSLAPSL